MRRSRFAFVFALASGAVMACGGGGTIVDAAGGGDAGGGDGATDEDAAAIDAPTIDGSGIDASAIDASGIDAGVIDASAIDAHDVDATPIDAAPIDALPIDAPPIDAPAIDAVPIDAVPIDAAPQTFYWADWTAATAGASGSATGGFAPPSGPVTIGYSGAVAFAQTSGGTNYWVPGAPYINAVTANAPPHSDIIAINAGAVVNTVTFDPPVTGLVMGVVSMGAPSTLVRYDFDRPFALLSFGAGYWGNGTLVVESGDVLAGAEGHGAIQFTGTVATLSWMVIGAENWHGFTFGIPQQ